VTFEDSNNLKVGEPVLAIGNPLGVGGSVTQGIVSALNRDIGLSPFDEFIQTDAAINHGNSGGPLFDLQGRVIGMNTALDSPTTEGGSIGIGFSMPWNQVRFIIDSSRQHGRVVAGWIGARVQPLTGLVARGLGLSNIDGAIVVQVLPNSPAAQAGLRRGDVVLRFDGQDVPEGRVLLRMAVIREPGSPIMLTVWRDGAEFALTVTLGGWPDKSATPPVPSLPIVRTAEAPTYGLGLSPLTAALRTEHRIPADMQGVLVTSVDANSSAADTELAVGDIIVQVGNEPVRMPAEVISAFKAALDSGKPSAVMLVQSRRELKWLGMQFANG
jgi:serine protease Do